jgi:hypothetical protein
MLYTREQIQKAVESKGYKWFEGGDYNLNIVGVRNSDTHGVVTNKFDDKLTISYSVNGEMKFQPKLTNGQQDVKFSLKNLILIN